MSSVTSQVLKSQLSSVYGTKYHSMVSPHTPRPVAVSTPRSTEHISLDPVTGSKAPLGKLVFELPLQVDIVKSINLDVTFNQGKISHGSASFARLVDHPLIALLKEVRVRFATKQLQTIKREEIISKLHALYTDEKFNQFNAVAGGGLTTTQRAARFLASKQNFKLNLITLLGVHNGADMSQSLKVRALAERVRIEIDLADASELFEADGTFGLVGQASGTTAVASPPNAEWLEDVQLYLECQHVTNEERIMLEQFSHKPSIYFFSDYQYSNVLIIPAAASLAQAQAISFDIREINQPVKRISILMRWAADTARAGGGAGGSRGRDYQNFRGWYNPAGATTAAGLPVIKYVEGTCGSNIRWLQRTDIKNLLSYERFRVGQGSSIEQGRHPIPEINFSDDPALEMAQLGFIDFTQLDNPRITFTLNAESTLSTIGDASTADVGASGALEVLLVAETFNQLNFQNSQIAKPYNG